MGQQNQGCGDVVVFCVVFFFFLGCFCCRDTSLFPAVPDLCKIWPGTGSRHTWESPKSQKDTGLVLLASGTLHKEASTQSGELWFYYFLPFPGRGEPLFPSSCWQHFCAVSYRRGSLHSGAPKLQALAQPRVLTLLVVYFVPPDKRNQPSHCPAARAGGGRMLLGAGLGQGLSCQTCCAVRCVPGGPANSVTSWLLAGHNLDTGMASCLTSADHHVQPQRRLNRLLVR